MRTEWNQKQRHTSFSLTEDDEVLLKKRIDRRLYYSGRWVIVKYYLCRKNGTMYCFFDLLCQLLARWDMQRGLW